MIGFLILLREQGPEGGNRPLFGDQEAISCDAQTAVVMKTTPSPALIVAETDFLLEVLIIALNAPSHLGEVNKTQERNVFIQI